MGEWRYSYIILDLGTRWKLVVSFTLWPLYGRELPWYPLDRRLGGPQCRSERCEEEKILPCRESNPDCRSRCYTDGTIPTHAENVCTSSKMDDEAAP
jgi:hypothetical protein